MTRILVTGATGFVGSHALEALAQRADINPVAACRDPKRLLPTFKGEVRVADLRDRASHDRLLEGIDVVCHAMAWTTLFGHGERSRDLYLEPTLDFLDACVVRGVRRFVNVSTTSAAAPERSADAMSAGIPRRFWPHLCSVVAIEEALRARAGSFKKYPSLRPESS